MLYRDYGKTGCKISAIGFGAMRFAEPQKIDESAELVLYAKEKGINYFDTAPGYCADKSEIIVGSAIKNMKREEFFVSTKSGYKTGGEVRKQLETSLQRLNVDCVDMYHVWCVMSQEDLEMRRKQGVFDAVQKAREEGLIRNACISTHMSGQDIVGVIDEGFFDGVLMGYCAINFPFRQKAVDAAEKANVGLVTMNPLGGGVIPNHADRFDFIRAENDPDVVTAALRFNVSQKGITSALVGFSRKEHIDQAVKAVENFEPYDRTHVDNLKDHIIEGFDGLCTGCGYCLPCPNEVEIPKLMDAFNQRILSDSSEDIINRLKWHWGGMTTDAAKACSACGACEKKCTQHLPIIERMNEIAKM